MQVYATTDQRMGLGAIEAHARRVEALGYDALCVPDAVHDGLLLSQAALRATTRLRVATSVLVAFPRSPMLVAIAAWDLQAASRGRFELGLGTQVRANVEQRYSTPWRAPVARMREYVQSLRAIWTAFQSGGPLRFEGEHYRFTKLQPFFNPGPIEPPPPPVLLGAVGPKMTALAGEVADALLLHPTNSSPRFLRDAVAPALGGADVARIAGSLVATGRDASAVERAREHARGLLGFLYSTPAYAPSLALFDRADLGERLRGLARDGCWGEMSAAIDDALLDAVVPAAPYAGIADVLRDAYAGLASRITFPVPDDPADDDHAAAAIAALRATA